MRKLLLLLLLVAVSLSFAEDASCCAAAGGCSELSPLSCSILGLVADWKVATVIALLFSTVLVSLAFMFGIGFEMPDIKAWASNELSQIIATAIILVVAIAVITLIDVTVMGIVNYSQAPGLTCNFGENCLLHTASFYLNDYIETSKEEAFNALDVSVNEMKTASTRINSHCSEVILPIPCLQYGWSSPPTFSDVGQAFLNAERAASVFENYQNLLSSMYAQKFFVENIAFKVGPLLLAFGVLARSLFFSRKLGGLLIAIAFGIMFVLPLMYLFDWVTMQLTIYGDLPFGNFNSNCPAECQAMVPPAYKQTNLGVVKYENLSSLRSDIYEDLRKSKPSKTEREDMVKATNIANDIYSGSAYASYGLSSGTTINSCAYLANHTVVTLNINIPCSANGTDYSDEADYTITTEGAGEPETCYLPKTKDYVCPVQCRELPYPYGIQKCAQYGTQLACSQLSDSCKIIRRVRVVDQAQYTSCAPKCKIIPPLKGDCQSKNLIDVSPFCPSKMNSPCMVDSCLDSRFDCRLIYRDGTRPLQNLAPQANTDPTKLILSLTKCFNAFSCATPTPATASFGDAANSCTYVFPNPADPDCKGCTMVEEAYIYDPPVRSAGECKAICSEQPNGKQRVGDDIPLLVEGNVGPTIITNLAKLMVPAYVLPLFNILVTVLFIRSFSKILGGDIEIPGLAKVL